MKNDATAASGKSVLESIEDAKGLLGRYSPFPWTGLHVTGDKAILYNENAWRDALNKPFKLHFPAHIANDGIAGEDARQIREAIADEIASDNVRELMKRESIEDQIQRAKQERQFRVAGMDMEQYLQNVMTSTNPQPNPQPKPRRRWLTRKRLEIGAMAGAALLSVACALSPPEWRIPLACAVVPLVLWLEQGKAQPSVG